MRSIHRAVDEMVAGGLTVGIQVAVLADGMDVRHCCGSDGSGRSIELDSVASVFCVTKALISACAGRLEESGELSLSSTLADARIGEGDPLGRVTLWDLLCHSSGLWGERPEMFMGLGEEASVRRAEGVSLRRRRAFVGAYGQFLGFHLLGVAIERLVGIPLESLVRSRVITPARLDDEVWFRAPGVFPHRRLRRSASRVDGRLVPWLWESSRVAIEAGSAANGAYASAHGMARLMQFVAQRAAVGGVAERCAAMAATRTGFDPVLGRRCRFSLGHLYDMRAHEFPDVVGSHSFGQIGVGGASCAVADLDNGVFFAWRDYLVHEDVTSIFAVRDRLVRAIYRSLSAADNGITASTTSDQLAWARGEAARVAGRAHRRGSGAG